MLTEKERLNRVKRIIKHNALHPGGTDNSTLYYDIRNAFLIEHPECKRTWSFFKDDENQLEIAKELINEETLKGNSYMYIRNDSILKGREKYYTVQYNKIILTSYFLAYAWNLGYKIDQTQAYLDDDLEESELYKNFTDIFDITKESKFYTDVEALIQYIISYLSLKEIVEYIVGSYQELFKAEIDNDTIKYLIYNEIYEDHQEDDVFRVIQLVSVDITNDSLSIRYGAIADNNIEYTSDNSVLTFFVNEETKEVKFRISDFDDMISLYNVNNNSKEISKTVLSQFFWQVYLSLTSIMNYIDRPHNTKELADKEYVYKEDKINRSELRNAAIKYTKYRHTRTTNEYYPEERRSPRAHERKEHYRMQWVGSKKDGTRHQELRLVRRSTVNPWNDKMGYNDNILGGKK